MEGKIITGDARSVISLRAAPNPTAPVVATLAQGEEVDFTAEQGDWLLGKWRGVQGWVDGKFVTFDGAPAVSGFWDTVTSWFTGKSDTPAVATTSWGSSGTTYYVVTNGGTLWMHKTPDVNESSRSISIPFGAPVTLQDATATPAGQWNVVKVSYNGTTGYVAKEYLRETAPATTPVSTPNNDNKSDMVTMTDKTQKVLKWGGIALAGGAVAYGIYRLFKKDDKAPKKKGKGKGVDGIPNRRRKKISHKAIPLE